MTTTSPTILGTICQSCAVLVANADETALHPNDLAACMSTIEQICAESGLWPTVDPATTDERTEFRCYTCHQDVLSYAHDLLADLPMHDNEARAIARDWQTSGTIGRHLASFASGATIAWPTVAQDARDTIAENRPASHECARLNRLAQWCEDQADREAEATIIRVLGAQRIDG